ncbi:MAG: hypothetical protein ACR2PT_01555 [Endozoicomonas sp.]
MTRYTQKFSRLLWWCFALLFVSSLAANEERVEPRDSLVVIHNANNRKGYSEYCLGVLTGEREVMTPAPCADTSFSTLTVCKDLSTCVQAVDDSWKRQGVALDYYSKGFKVRDADDISVVKLNLDAPLPGVEIARIAPPDIECGSALECYMLARKGRELKWTARSMQRDCVNAAFATEFYAAYKGVFTHPENFTVITGALLFDHSARFVGGAYDWNMIFHRNEGLPVRCHKADSAVTVEQARFEL